MKTMMSTTVKTMKRTKLVPGGKRALAYTSGLKKTTDADKSHGPRPT